MNVWGENLMPLNDEHPDLFNNMEEILNRQWKLQPWRLWSSAQLSCSLMQLVSLRDVISKQLSHLIGFTVYISHFILVQQRWRKWLFKSPITNFNPLDFFIKSISTLTCPENYNIRHPWPRRLLTINLKIKGAKDRLGLNLETDLCPSAPETTVFFNDII